jgi:CBS domain-containing protein
VARTTIDDAVGLAAADVIHKRFTALPDSATIGDVRKWFAASSHRRVAFLAEDGHYVGSLTPADLAGDLDASRRASEVARRGATIAPDAPASAAHELALSSDTRRVPVVDRHGRLVGVVGVTDDLAAFCGSA